MVRLRLTFILVAGLNCCKLQSESPSPTTFSFWSPHNVWWIDFIWCILLRGPGFDTHIILIYPSIFAQKGSFRHKTSSHSLTHSLTLPKRDLFAVKLQVTHSPAPNSFYLSPIEISNVIREINRLNPRKAPGPDSVGAKVIQLLSVSWCYETCSSHHII